MKVLELAPLLAAIALMELQGLVAAQEPASPAHAVAEPPSQSANASVAAETNSDLIYQISAPVLEILKMTKGGVSLEVIKSFVENSPTEFKPTAADLIALKKHGVPDEIALALLKQHAQANIQTGPTSGNADLAMNNRGPVYQSPAVIAPRYPTLDPESYDYFRYYYLHPRTLASVYQRLGFYGGYPGPFSLPYSNGFGYYGRAWR